MNFTALTLEQVYGTMAHYLAHRDEIEEYLRNQRAAFDQARSRADQNPSDALLRLRQTRTVS